MCRTSWYAIPWLLILTLLVPARTLLAQPDTASVRRALTAMLEFRGDVVSGRAVVDICGLYLHAGAATAAAVMASVKAEFTGSAADTTTACSVTPRPVNDRMVLRIIDISMVDSDKHPNMVSAAQPIKIATALVEHQNRTVVAISEVGPQGRNLSQLAWVVYEYRIASIGIGDRSLPPPRLP